MMPKTTVSCPRGPLEWLQGTRQDPERTRWSSPCPVPSELFQIHMLHKSAFWIRSLLKKGFLCLQDKKVENHYSRAVFSNFSEHQDPLEGWLEPRLLGPPPAGVSVSEWRQTRISSQFPILLVTYFVLDMVLDVINSVSVKAKNLVLLFTSHQGENWGALNFSNSLIIILLVIRELEFEPRSG